MSRAALSHLGSLRTTLAGCALLAAVVFAQPTWPWLGAAMGVLAANLVAALVAHPALRQRFALLVAHLAMLALLVTAGFGRLVAVDGRFELTENVAFDGVLIDGTTAPRHRDALAAMQLQQHGFTIDYEPRRKRGATNNRVSWTDANADGARRQAVIGDHRALVVDGWRITTSSNKGFAPVLRWTPAGGEPVVGSAHLPSFPVHELRQSVEWTLPGGGAVWVMLVFDDKLIDPDKAASFALPSSHRLVVRVGDVRHELAPGASMTLAGGGGELRYEGLRTWMGYRVSRDPTLPWLLAAALLAVAAMAAHYVQLFWFDARRSARRAGPQPSVLVGDVVVGSARHEPQPDAGSTRHTPQPDATAGAARHAPREVIVNG